MPYPDTLDSFPTLVDNVDTVLAQYPNERANAITNIMTALGENLYNLSIIGEIRLWAGAIASIPTGWKHLDASAISRTTYSELFEVIGTTYGVGDGSTTFTLPDTRDLFLIGASEDASSISKTNITGSLLKTGGSTTTSTYSTDSGLNSGGNNVSGSHAHTFYPPFVALTMIIFTGVTSTTLTVEVFITLVDNVDTVFAEHFNSRADAIETLQAAIGVNLNNTKMTGEVRAWSDDIASIPSGWLFCNGAVVNKTDYPDLYGVITNNYGTATADSIADSSSNTFTVTNVNSCTFQTDRKVFGSTSLAFNSGTGYLTVPDNTAFDFSGGIWTVDAWIYPTAISGDISIWSQSTDANNYIDLRIESTGLLALYVVSATSTIVAVKTAIGAVVINQWQHIAIVENGNNFYIFINGVNVTVSGGTDADRPANYTGTFQIGTRLSGSQHYNGYMDEFRVSKGIARWTAGFTPSTSAYASDGNTSLLLHFELVGTFTLPDCRDVFIIGTKQDDSGSAKTNITGSLLKTGGSLTQPPTTNADGNNGAGNSGGEAAISSHTHTFVPPYTAVAYMIRT